MSGGKKKRPVAPIYTIAAVWLLFSLINPIRTFGRLIAVLVLSAVGYGIAKAATRDKTAQEAPAEPAPEEKQPEVKIEPPQKDEPKYPPAVQAVVDAGDKAHAELRRLYRTIPDLTVKRKVVEIMDISDKIIQDAIDDPSDVPQIKKFLDYYLPTTIKLLNAYDRMGAQGIEGSNISGTMQSIDEMLDTAINAYKKLLDNLFANQAMDIETDIDVMNTLLKREGLASSGEGGLSH